MGQPLRSLFVSQIRTFSRVSLSSSAPSLSSLSPGFVLPDRQHKKDLVARNRQLYFDSLPRMPVWIGSRYFSATSSEDPLHKPATEETRRERFRTRAANMRSNMRDRASSLQESAKEQYQEFREHPRQTARAGAKSLGGMIKLYGPVFLGTYFSVYFATLGTLFVGVESGVLDPVSLFSMIGGSAAESKNTVDFVVDFMQHHTLTEPYAHFFEKNPQFANLAVAWITVKFTEPVRLAVSAAITPKIARKLGYAVPKEVEDLDELATKEK